MRVKINPFLGVMMIAVVLTGCNKLEDYVENYHNGIAYRYQIKKFKFLSHYSSTPDSMEFTYNSRGNPVRGVRPEPNTGAPNFFFYYDRHHRLTDLIGAYGNTPFDRDIESWNKYFYNSKGQIVKDSLYFFPDVVNGQPVVGEHGVYAIYLYEYDSKGRISKVYWYSQGVQEPQISTYSYNASGNLAGPVYDNKINFRQTNKIWMFFDRDYSINNAINGTFIYNKHGLPTKIDCFEGHGSSFMNVPSTNLSYKNATIEYDFR